MKVAGRAGPLTLNTLVLGSCLHDGGKTFRPISGRTHVDFHAFWIDPKDPNRMWQGQDGGIAVSYDRGEHWEYVNNIPVGQFYQVAADNRQPFYWVHGGLQDNGGWTGPSRTREPAGILNDDWRMVEPPRKLMRLYHGEGPRWKKAAEIVSGRPAGRAAHRHRDRGFLPR